MSVPKSVGFIGLGVMGLRMVERLTKLTERDVVIYVFDVNTEVTRVLAEQHPGRVVVQQNSREVAASSHTVLTMVPEGHHLRSVYMTPDVGILSADLSDRILIDCSTIDITTSSLVRQAVKEKSTSASFYDCPVSGGSLGAENGTLTFMLGCGPDDQNVGFLQSILSMLGKSIIPCGRPGLGLLAKFCNNYCSGLIAIATSEAFNIAMSQGMDPRILHKIFKTSTASSTVNDTWNPVPGLCPDAPSSHGYQGGFKLRLMRKDFGLAVDAAKSGGARLALGDAALKLYTEASTDPEYSELDARVVFKYLGGKQDWEADQVAGRTDVT
ncbi:hypothetical protein LTR05_008411 [Lithohypha guttulata]|uniref:3-hydroxyisobutyrate dehydrogenase n=1 Tax=Lithohypha guttulata TaxID=1690604 RepID=A0AAN7PK44_9EURO|nr:hypothetical protein LTR05_008411 [Lithohypha guttulata]